MEFLKRYILPNLDRIGRKVTIIEHKSILDKRDCIHNFRQHLNQINNLRNETNNSELLKIMNQIENDINNNIKYVDYIDNKNYINY